MPAIFRQSASRLSIGGTGTFIVWLLLAALRHHGAAAEIDHPMWVDPQLPSAQRTVFFPANLKPLWLEALAGPEADLRRQAADAIRQAHQSGLVDMSDCAAQLTVMLSRSDEHPAARLSAMRALAAIDARQTADQLAGLLPAEGVDAAQIIEPALARWNYAPMRSVWLQRLDEEPGSHSKKSLAMRSLAAVGDTSAAPKLLKIAGNRTAKPSLRLDAARALGELRTDGLEQFAADLLAAEPPAAVLDRLVAAESLRGHQTDEAVPILLELAQDEEPSVAAAALSRLLRTDPSLIAPIAAAGVKNPDANVRRLCAEALVARPDAEGLKALGPLLDDPHPDVRIFVADSLVELAENEPLRENVISEAVAMLRSDRWRGLEQATMVLGALDYEPVAERFIELLSFDRPEVMVAAAWGLRRLAIPETLPAMLQHAREQAEFCRQQGLLEPQDKQLTQLFQAFGLMEYRESEELLRQFVPKMPFYGYDARLAAVWSLGKLHVDDPQSDLVTQLEERLNDMAPVFPEFFELKIMAAVSLGRMNADAALPSLRSVYRIDSPNSYLGQACSWAIHQITGEPIRAPEDYEVPATGWLLQPIE